MRSSEHLDADVESSDAGIESVGCRRRDAGRWHRESWTLSSRSIDVDVERLDAGVEMLGHSRPVSWTLSSTSLDVGVGELGYWRREGWTLVSKSMDADIESLDAGVEQPGRQCQSVGRWHQEG